VTAAVVARASAPGSRVRFVLAIAALVLGLGAAIVRTPAPRHPRTAAVAPVYKPPNGC
jgi:hypothetical protein